MWEKSRRGFCAYVGVGESFMFIAFINVRLIIAVVNY